MTRAARRRARAPKERRGSVGPVRPTMFVLHRWIGLVLAVLVVPVLLSGAALMLGPALDRVVHPGRYAVSGQAVLAPSAYADAARRTLRAGQRIAAITVNRSGPVVADVSSAGMPQGTAVFLNPPTGRVLGQGARSIVGALHDLHTSLFMGHSGRWVLGCVGLVVMLLALSGVWLWRPTVGSLLHGLRWRRHAQGASNLHHAVGLWTAVPLLVLSASGAWLAFSIGKSMPIDAGKVPLPIARAAMSPDRVVAAASTLNASPWVRIVWPTERSADWTVSFQAGGSVKVADDAGTVVRALDAERHGTEGLMRRLHGSGSDGGLASGAWRIVAFLTGLASLPLLLTGVAMWWTGRRKAEGKRDR
ncbi:Uncharacterized iron-regulated membrane protein [Sphingomonas gellani]|uniref:Uncharacterized iron-regulated membrane protein n=1 Tax=Sphingomonas gellani TaxID=1166340 RepID=A0A1H8G7I0_9SPHN|nr:PepSY-associated TM helix domain-containing protein [Sphingomonas gellani]SEN39238.1 Uncharacterized iron-regulated membrane protein [Sphingomonas gellani]